MYRVDCVCGFHAECKGKDIPDKCPDCDNEDLEACEMEPITKDEIREFRETEAADMYDDRRS